MDKLKDFIDNNHEAFDDERLPEGHFERFEAKLATAPSARKPSGRKQFYMAAAFVAAACMALLFILRMPGGSLTPVPVQQEANLSCPKEEIQELHIYYTMQINDVMARMEEICKQDPSPATTELWLATKQILHDNYLFEQTELPSLPCNNNGLYAMTQHYTNSVEGLSYMLKQMETIAKK